jgi:hypothetical protein
VTLGLQGSHVRKTTLESSASQHEKGSKTHNRYVSKVKRKLQQASHTTGMQVKVERKAVNHKTSHASVAKGFRPQRVRSPFELESEQVKRQEAR